LSRDGLIAVSIDDNEVSRLGVLLDEIFGARNRLACAPWLAEPSGGKQKTALRQGHEYLLIYHNGDSSNLTREEKSTGELDRKDKFGKFRKGRELLKWGDESLKQDREDMWFPLCAPDGTLVYPIRNDGQQGRWRLGQKNPLIQNMRLDPEYVHWEMRPFDEGITVADKVERWVPYEKVRDAKKSFGWTTWLDTFGFNADATRELKDIFGHKPFETPKPMALIRWLVSLHADDDALVLDTFAGSGTTAHAVLGLNKEDGGNRRFILVEMEPKIAREITAERVRRVAEGYKNGKGEIVKGLGGSFRFCELGEPMFDESGRIHATVSFADLARHVYFTETGEPLPGERVAKSSFLGACRGVGIYLLYNGILDDKTVNGGNVLTRSVLAKLPRFEGQRVIYCAGCLLAPDRLKADRILVRQTPYEIKVS